MYATCVENATYSFDGGDIEIVAGVVCNLLGMMLISVTILLVGHAARNEREKGKASVCPLLFAADRRHFAVLYSILVNQQDDTMVQYKESLLLCIDAKGT
jgi:hypothetical protein